MKKATPTKRTSSSSAAKPAPRASRATSVLSSGPAKKVLTKVIAGAAAKRVGKKVLNKAVTFAKEKPLVTAAAAAGAGFLVGMIARGSSKPSDES
ncbi:hypothetical protein SAMN05444156_2289 [Verrucomicrobium sp. GAS474]|uniref:hypothetical protein n=1 Tax=Verrucomicrobium sp. GAS474 TaxID=1882831 RepID=UPI00087D90E2|nr:hypothetical protein [Verrucomicrobium sp. GAS474]SDU15519.1 hypothetical protein SAMN05444156_2289 [Verrucomicrobium sp. GAS474]